MIIDEIGLYKVCSTSQYITTELILRVRSTLSEELQHILTENSIDDNL